LLEISSCPVLRFYGGTIKKQQQQQQQQQLHVRAWLPKRQNNGQLEAKKNKQINYAPFIAVLLDISSW